jgi:predicted outer membrane protein
MRDTAVAADAAGEVVNDDTTAVRNDQVWITDGNALALLRVMNTRQISAADVELEAWHTDTVRAFAASVARDHAELQHSVDSLVERTRVAPVVSALVQRVDTAFRLRVDSLRAIEGRPLELAFARQQVVAESAFATVADQLTGAATAPEVRGMMQSAAARARAESDRARSLLATLMLADSIKKAAVADSIARAEERRQRRARRTP